MLHVPIKVAVCLAAFNGEQHISEQLSSILNQVGVEVTVYISVDLSSDNTITLIKEYAKQDARIVLLSYGERYGSAAKNFFRLIEEVNFSAFDYVSFADQDDIWLSKKLISAVSAIQNNNADAYSSNVLAFWTNNKQRVINKAQPQKEWDYMYESAGPGCTFVLSKELVLALQVFLVNNQKQHQEVALHDWFMYAYARFRGYKWIISNESHMLYRQHDDNVVGANVGIKAKLVRFKKLREGWLFKQAILIAEILGYANDLPIRKIKRFKIVDRIWLMLNARKLRRRLRDQVALMFLMVVYIRR